MKEFTIVCMWMAVGVGLLWVGFMRVRRLDSIRGADFVRRPQVEVLQSSNKPPRNARKPDWTRNELIRLSALMSGQSRRLLGERLIGYMPSGLGCRWVRVLPVSSLNLMPCKCSD